MTTSINRRRLCERFGRAAALFLLVLTAALFQASAAHAQWATSGGNTTTTNNVGIGIATPAQMFHVHSIGRWAGMRVTTASTGTTMQDGAHFGYDDDYGAYIWNREATSVVLSTNDLERMRIDPAGNLGLGTNAPASKLHVRDTDTTPDNELFVETTTGNYGPTLRLKSSIPGQPADFLLTATGSANAGGAGAFRIYDYSANATRFFIAPTTGNVGVGTTSPGTLLDVGAGATPRGNYSDILVGSGGNNAQMEFYGPTKSSAITHDETIGGMIFYTNGPMWSPSMIVANGGNVGIGTTTPAAKLDVAGDIRVSGNINAKYQDVAEWVPTTEKLSAGTVVVLDAQHANHVNASTKSYDTGVAGVVSAQPGITLGEAGEGKALVATTGRVKVRVDATRAPVRIGDLIVTSDVAGVGMKSEPVVVGGITMHRPGTIIGKALESLEKGTGEILVLLSLQ